ncbi:hypothetical protein [Nostoc sp. C117]
MAVFDTANSMCLLGLYITVRAIAGIGHWALGMGNWAICVT